jgi:hypothetical protein
MEPEQRYAWIEKWLRDQHPEAVADRVDVLNASFVDAYLDATNAKCAVMPYGAHKCAQLGRDLSAMFKAGRLTRSVASVTGVAGMGYPTWVYSYKLLSRAPENA